MPVSIDGTAGIVNNATDLNYTGSLTGGTGVVNLGSGQFYKDASGNVGIGTSSPQNRLHVEGNITLAGYGTVQASGSTTGISLLGGNQPNSANSGAQINLRGTVENRIEFIRSGNIESARIDSSGNLLVGATTQRAAARVGIDINPATNAAVVIYPTTNFGYDALRFLNNASTQVGNIGVGLTTTSYNTSSDYRLKDTIAPMQGALARITALKPCTYKWKVDGSDGEGFIAHELQAVVPDCVTGEKDAVDDEGKPKYQGIDTSFLVATLTAAIQELKAIVDTQAARITALEGKPA